MKYKSLMSFIRDGSYKSEEKTYKSLASSSRSVLEGFKDVEVDPSDQIAAGTYKTRHFEVSPDAQILFTNIPRDPRMDHASLEKLAIEMDILFGIQKNAIAREAASEEDVSSASQIAKKIYHFARALNLHNQVGFIDDSLRQIQDYFHRSGGVSPEKTFLHPPKTMTKEKPDKDIDNTAFTLSRANKAQRKLKIIDDD